MKTLQQLEQENTDGFRNPERTEVQLELSLKTLAELEAESTDGFRNPDKTIQYLKSDMSLAWEILNAALYDLTVGNPADGIAAVEEAISILEKSE